jgi:chromosome segregation ATPase
MDVEVLTPEEAEARIAEARAVLAQAEADEKQRRMAGLRFSLAQVRQERPAAEARYQELCDLIHYQAEVRANAQGRVARAFEALRESERQRPEVAEFLPEDPEVVRWRKAHEALKAQCERRIAERDALPDPDRLRPEAAEVGSSILNLKLAEQNLIRALRGRGGVTRIEGSVSFVA